MTLKRIKNHHYDNCDGGICLNCDRCLRPDCCEQTEECLGHNWDFLFEGLVGRKKSHAENDN